MADNLVLYRGVEVGPDWPARIRSARGQAAYEIAGVSYLRIPYGRERRRWPAGPCHDCAVQPSELHVPGCDAEECPRCHGQAFACDCTEPADPLPPGDIAS